MTLRSRIKNLGQRVQHSLEEARSLALSPKPESALSDERPEPPVVARLMIEIRSDGTHTIARGALEDYATDQRVAIEAHGTTPMELAASLAKSMLTLPLFASAAVRALLGSTRPPAADLEATSLDAREKRPTSAS
jgi:hypothetical protein